MHPPKTLCWMVLVAMFSQLTGCNSFLSLQEPLPPGPDSSDPNRIVGGALAGWDLC
jgi:hypothetical protein